MKKVLLIIAVIVSINVDAQLPRLKYGRGISSATNEDGTKSFIYRDPLGSGMATWFNGTLKLYGDTLSVISSLMEYSMNSFNRFSEPLVIIFKGDTSYCNRYRSDTIRVDKLPLERR